MNSTMKHNSQSSDKSRNLSQFPSFQCYHTYHNCQNFNDVETRPAKCKPDAKSSTEDEKFKTKLCHHFMTTGTCFYGTKCHFAHGEHQLRRTDDSAPLIHPRHKTTLCQNEMRHGICKFGKVCKFIHKEDPEYKLLQQQMLDQKFFFQPSQQRNEPLVEGGVELSDGQHGAVASRNSVRDEGLQCSGASGMRHGGMYSLPIAHESTSQKESTTSITSGLFVPIKKIYQEIKARTTFQPGTPVTSRKLVSYGDRRTAAATVWGVISPRVAVWEKRLRGI